MRSPTSTTTVRVQTRFLRSGAFGPLCPTEQSAPTRQSDHPVCVRLTCSVSIVLERGLDRLYDVAESRGGYFTTRHAARAGVSSRLLSYYVAGGDIERVAHGVYRLARFPVH